MTRLASLLATACAAAAIAAGCSEASPLRGAAVGSGSELCWIETRGAASSGDLIAWAAPGVTGAYELTVRAADGSGRVDTRQSGPIEPAGSGPTLLSRVTAQTASYRPIIRDMRSDAPLVGGGAGTARVQPSPFAAQLRVRDGSGRTICTASV
ncbi:hypothetical protein FKB34_02650 [Glycocaulis profundi]|nr:hypothetical protein FKB34_02650 [Glycocaulis profundi]